MRSEPDELKRCVVGFAINQDQIRPQVAIAMIAPVSDQGVITIFQVQFPITDQSLEQCAQVRIERFGMATPLLALIIFLERCGTLNRPHSDRP